MLEYGTAEYDEEYARFLQARIEIESEPYVFITPEWCGRFEQAVQTDDRYKQVARNWEGSVVLVVQADPTVGLDRASHLFLDLWHGECNCLSLVPEDKGAVKKQLPLFRVI